MKQDVEFLRRWVGRTELIEDSATLASLRALAATLDHADQQFRMGAPIPPCWHWLYFLPMARQSEIGPDGHPLRDGFLPPVALPRRMWAGSRIEFLAPLRAGQPLQRLSSIEDVLLKEGRTGPLVFVKVRHEIRAYGTLAVTEEQDIVYRELPSPSEPAPTYRAAPGDASWSRRIEPDDVLLFRYSALTFNSHRIHYDRRYVTGVEGYPGLVVHGPLIATLLLDLLRRECPSARVRNFRFRAIKPLFDVSSFDVCGRMRESNTAALWTRDADGDLTLEATALLD